MILGAGAQLIDGAKHHEAQQDPGVPTPLASFSVTELGAKADKIGKDDNFRGIAVHDNVVYYTKGSGGNGVNTVYFVDTTGTACPSGVGVPSPKAVLPTAPLAYNAATLQTAGLPNNMCVLAGFPSTPNKTATTLAYPFGIWFADANTLYVADEGDGYTGGADLYTHAAAQKTAGLQKWVLRRGYEAVEARLYAAERVESRSAVFGRRLPGGQQFGHGPAVGTGDGRPAQPDGPRRARRHGDDLGDYVDRQRQRRRRCGSEPAGGGA